MSPSCTSCRQPWSWTPAAQRHIAARPLPCESDGYTVFEGFNTCDGQPDALPAAVQHQKDITVTCLRPLSTYSCASTCREQREAADRVAKEKPGSLTTAPAASAVMHLARALQERAAYRWSRSPTKAADRRPLRLAANPAHFRQRRGIAAQVKLEDSSACDDGVKRSKWPSSDDRESGFPGFDWPWYRARSAGTRFDEANPRCSGQDARHA